MGYDPQKTTWYNPDIEYLFNTEIIEYDMRDAGFSLIKQFQLLPQEKIQELERMGKGLQRHIEVGKLQGADKEFSKALLDKFAEVRSIFISTNNIHDNDIVSVKKDAIFVVGQVNRTKFGLVDFMPKNTYSSYIRFADINNLELYFHDGVFDIKGMSEQSESRHRLWMIEFLRNVFRMIEDKDVRVKRYMMKFVNEYKSLSLDEEFYIEFNNLSCSMNPLFNYQKIIIPLMQIITKEVE